MNILLELIPTGLLQGLILAIVALGIFIPFRLLNFPDLTSEGSYPLGGIVCASLLVAGVSPSLSMILAVICAGLLGIGTAFVHIYLRVNTLLAGIILTTMAYSFDLRLMGRPNIALFDQYTLFTRFQESMTLKCGFVFLILIILIGLLFWFLKTEKGLRFRAVGMNPHFAERQGINLKIYIILGLFSGNALCGLAGSLMVQLQSYADIGMGIGILIHGLAALMIGESVFKGKLFYLLTPFLGALIYQQIQGLALALGLEPSDLKFFTGFIVLSVIALRRKDNKEATLL